MSNTFLSSSDKMAGMFEGARYKQSTAKLLYVSGKLRYVFYIVIPMFAIAGFWIFFIDLMLGGSSVQYIFVYFEGFLIINIIPIILLVAGFITMRPWLRSRRIEYYDDFIRVFLPGGKTKDIPYSQLELSSRMVLSFPGSGWYSNGGKWDNVSGKRVKLGRKRSIRFKLSVRDEEKASIWTVICDYPYDLEGDADPDLYSWLAVKLKGVVYSSGEMEEMEHA